MQSAVDAQTNAMKFVIEAHSNAVKFAAEGYTMYRTCVQNLVTIVYSEKTSSDKLREIKKLLLTTKTEEPLENKVPPNALSDLFAKITDTSVDFKMISQLTDLMQRATAPYDQFSTLREKIGEVIRTSDKTDDEKIDLISDLLV